MAMDQIVIQRIQIDAVSRAHHGREENTPDRFYSLSGWKVSRANLAPSDVCYTLMKPMKGLVCTHPVI
jgi:hypothetical protein